MGTTPNGYPYPEDTDPVAAGAQAIKAVATKVDTALRASAAGKATINVSAASLGTVTVTFPAGRFTAPPAITAVVDNSGYFCGTDTISATSARIWARQYTSSNATIALNAQWHATATG